MPKAVQLVKASQPLFHLRVHPTTDGQFLREPSQELLHYFGRALEAPPKWYFEPGAPALELCLEFRPNCGLTRDAFLIEANQQAVKLRASTLSGIWNAVYFFLEQALGIRWLWPGDSGEVIPRATEVAWPVGLQTYAPDWLWRRHGLGGALWEEQDFDLAWRARCSAAPQVVQALENWHRRMRLGGLNIADGHRWAEICSPLDYGQSHPEYFALVDGKRDAVMGDGKHGNQPCTSNPDVARLVADYLIAQFRARPELDGFSMAINDGLGFCECDRCAAIDAWAGEASAESTAFDEMTADGQPPPGEKVITDRMLKFANDVAELVAADYPDKLVVFLIYSAYRRPPERVRLRPNVMAQFCTATWSWLDPKTERFELDTLSRLGSYAGEIGIYDYLVNGANGSMPRGFARIVARTIKAAHDKGARYYATQPGTDFALQGFTYYLLARVLWDVDADPEAVLDDFCRSGFGAGAAQVKQYLTAYMDLWERNLGTKNLKVPHMEQQVFRLYPDDWRAQRRAKLASAAAACSGDPPAADRVRFLTLGLDFLDLYCEAGRRVAALLDDGVPFPADEERLRQWLEEEGSRPGRMAEAVGARDRLLEWTDAHANQFIFADVWFHYQRRGNSLLGGFLDLCAAVLGRERNGGGHG